MTTEHDNMKQEINSAKEMRDERKNGFISKKTDLYYKSLMNINVEKVKIIANCKKNIRKNEIIQGTIALRRSYVLCTNIYAECDKADYHENINKCKVLN